MKIIAPMLVGLCLVSGSCAPTLVNSWKATRSPLANSSVLVLRRHLPAGVIRQRIKKWPDPSPSLPLSEMEHPGNHTGCFGIVISADGRPLRIQVLKSTGYNGIDSFLVKTLAGTTWFPATKDGKPIVIETMVQRYIRINLPSMPHRRASGHPHKPPKLICHWNMLNLMASSTKIGVRRK